MNRLPQTATVSDIRHRHLEVMDKAKDGPVMLSSRGEPVAVIVSPQQWNAIVDRLDDLDDLVTGMEVLLAMQSGEESIEDVNVEEMKRWMSEHVVSA